MAAVSAQTRSASEGESLTRQARVTTTARLHFGFLDPSGRGKHPFGSFGLALDRPRTRLTLKPAQAFKVRGVERARAERYLRSIADSCGVQKTYDLHVEEAIPPHAGLGSGTQLALAIGSAFAALEGLSLDPQEIAARLGRGARSGIGIATFARGGVVLDSGPHQGELPQLVSRLPFPSAWRVLLIFDASARGLAGPNETAAFDQLPDFSESEVAELNRRITKIAMPALAAGNFAAFCDEVGRLQAVMGTYFAPLQGGPYLSAGVSEALEWLRGQGVTGLGQSSWGPTGFAFAASEAEGQALLRGMRIQVKRGDLSFELAQGRNEGARVEIS
ncbi:MAG TPA: GHMP kinase [Methyloceanibacter sp.]|jgi:beta-RFAP synthase|nr:GHMP kinase [Methyloceanibacter sp.]